MLSTLKNLVVDPATAFTNVEEKLTPAAAGLIVAVSGVLSAGPVVAAARDPQAGGIVLMVLFRSVAALLVWGIAAVTAHLVGRGLMRGIGAMRTTTVALGLATVPDLFQGVVGTALVFAGRANSPFLMVFFGWHTVLMIIALREVHDLHTPRAILATFVVGIVVFLGLTVLAPLEWYVYPSLTDEPFAEPGPAWDEAQLPPNASQWLTDGDFEEIASAEEARPIRKAVRMAAGSEVPAGWLPLPIVPIRTRKNRDVLFLGRLEVDFARDTSVAFRGRASARVRRSGPRVGPPVAWGWGRAVATTRLRQKYQEDLDTAQDEQKREGLSRILEHLDRSPILEVGEGGEAYFAVRLRGEDVCAATLMAVVHAEDARQPLVHVAETLHGSFEWQDLRLKVALPAKTHGIVVMAVLWGGGTLWVDDARLLYPREGPEELQPDEESEWAPLKPTKKEDAAAP